MARQRTPGRAWAWFGFGVGIVASVAGNVAHQYVKHETPPVGALVWAAVVPLGLMLAIEVITRVPWPSQARWKIMRFGGASLVAAVAAFISYKHLYGLIRSYGEDPWSAAVGPLAIDGLMAVCSAALLATAKHRGPGHREPAAADPTGEPVVADAPRDPDPLRDLLAMDPSQEKVDRVRIAMALEPGATIRQLADLAQVSQSTVKRVKRMSAQVNGQAVAAPGSTVEQREPPVTQ